MSLKEKREQRLKLVSDARALMDAAGKEKRDLTQEESQRVDQMMDDADKLKKEIDAADRSESRKSRLESAEKELKESRGRHTDPENPSDPERRKGDAVELEVRGQKLRFEPGSPEHRRCQPDYLTGFRSWLRGEQRALQTDLDSAGGFLTVPEQFLATLLKDVDDEVMIRNISRVLPPITAQSIGVPTRQSKMQAFGWGQELSAPNKDTNLKFGKRSMTPHYMTGEILLSRDLLRAAIIDPESIVMEEIAREAGELEEQAFLTGSGAQQPLGLFTASTDGIDTSRDVSTDNTTTAITMDGLMNALYHLKGRYQNKATWLFHRHAMRNIRKLKDGAGQYIWQPADKPGEPDSLLQRPVRISEWVPNTFTTGQYVGIVGDFDMYWIVDSLMLEIQKLVEKYAENNQVAFIARRKVDGAPARAEAFARVKLG